MVLFLFFAPLLFLDLDEVDLDFLSLFFVFDLPFLPDLPDFSLVADVFLALLLVLLLVLLVALDFFLVLEVEAFFLPGFDRQNAFTLVPFLVL